MGIKARRNKNQLRLKAAGGGPHNLHINVCKSLIASTSGKWHIQRRALALSSANVVQLARTGIPGKLMRRYKHHTWIVIEYVLSAVAMMYIVIHNQYAFQPVRHLRMARGDSDVREQAKAHSHLWRGVMPRRAGLYPGVIRFLLPNGIHATDRRTAGEFCHPEGRRQDVSIRPHLHSFLCFRPR